MDRVISGEDDVTAAWVGRVLGQVHITQLKFTPGSGNWSRQLGIEATAADGTRHALRLKTCLGNTFGRSEVDYYTRDYVGLADAPLVRCFDAQYDPAVGYHLLLQDLSATHDDQRDVQPTLAYGIAVAQALGRLHRHHWCTGPAPGEAALSRYLDECSPGLGPLQQATGHALAARFGRFEQAFRQRWASPRGMALLHGDLNPTNILAPRGQPSPVLFLDRQPFDWSLTYGVAVSDLAYFMAPWWPELTRRACEFAVLRHWYEALGKPDYSWNEALADWRLAVEQCLLIPLEWCSKPDTLGRMRWLWELQLKRVLNALDDPGCP